MENKLQYAQPGVDSPIFGKRVLVTRSSEKASDLSQLLSEEGAVPVEVPTIEIAPLESYSELDSKLLLLSDFEWVVFGSANGVEAVISRLHALGLGVEALKDVKVAAVGPATAKALRDVGVVVDILPDSYKSDALAASFKDSGIREHRILVPSADIGGHILLEGLSSLGAVVDRVAAYRNTLPKGSRERVEEALEGGVDVVAFTSSSTARNLVSLLEEDVSRISSVSIACIGPVTALTTRGMGLTVDVVATEYTLPGLVAALKEYYRKEEV